MPIPSRLLNFMIIDKSASATPRVCRGESVTCLLLSTLSGLTWIYLLTNRFSSLLDGTRVDPIMFAEKMNGIRAEATLQVPGNEGFTYPVVVHSLLDLIVKPKTGQKKRTIRSTSSLTLTHSTLPLALTAPYTQSEQSSQYQLFDDSDFPKLGGRR